MTLNNLIYLASLVITFANLHGTEIAPEISTKSKQEYIIVAYTDKIDACVKKAKEGDPESIYQLGLIHYELDNILEAAQWFKIGVEKQNKHCAYMLAFLYSTEKLDDVDDPMQEFFKWTKIAAELGHENAQITLRLIDLQNKANSSKAGTPLNQLKIEDDKTVYQLEEFARNGNISAMHAVAARSNNPQDRLKLLEQAAKKGDPVAQKLLEDFYKHH